MIKTLIQRVRLTNYMMKAPKML